jgi:hypothetical protein
LGVTACLLAGLALIAATIRPTTILTQPLSGIGLLLGLISAVAVGGARPVRLVLPLCGAGVSAVVLIAALFFPDVLGPRYAESRLTADTDANAIRVVALRLTANGNEALETDGYADASRAAVQQGMFRVKILSATVGPVQVVDAKRRYTKQSYLAVTVQIQDLGSASRVRLVHWGAPGERTVPDATATAGGRTLAPANLGADVPVGVSYGQYVFPARSATDLLVFEAPLPGTSVRLELPAEAWDGHGVFRFQIPSSMIGPQSGKPPQ